MLGFKLLCALIGTESLALVCGFKQRKPSTIAGSILQETTRKASDPTWFCCCLTKEPQVLRLNPCLYVWIRAWTWSVDAAWWMPTAPGIGQMQKNTVISKVALTFKKH